MMADRTAWHFFVKLYQLLFGGDMGGRQ